MSKPETIAALKRKIERLEARIQSLTAAIGRNADYNREDFIARSDAETRIKQAMRILSGEDEA